MKTARKVYFLLVILAAPLLSLSACASKPERQTRSNDSDAQTVWESKTPPGVKPINGPEENGLGF